MPDTEKEIVLNICKYAEMVNAQIGDLLYRMKLAEAALQANPQILQAYNEAVRHTPRTAPPGLPRQLLAIQQLAQHLPD